MLPSSRGAEIGGFVSASLSGIVWLVVDGPEGVVLTAPTPAVVCLGICLRKASRKAGVPKVSVNAIPRTYIRVSFRPS